MQLLGIPNCDTVKKARRSLETKGVDFEFRDIRKQPLQDDEWRSLIEQDADGRLVNTRSPSFRKLGFKASDLDASKKLEVLSSTPTAMKRPVLLKDGDLLAIGFDQEFYETSI